MKISFLIPAHNEEEIIAETLNNLLNLPYEDYEVIIGLDGCTDNTEEIIKSYVKKSKKFRYFKLNLRKGKPAVIDVIIKKARGGIIIINDADWIFRFENRNKLQQFIGVFDDAKIGGIAESFPVEWDYKKIKMGNLGYKMVAYGTYFWLRYQKENFAEKKGEILRVKNPRMFLTNIFRKELYEPNISLGDDFERTQDIFNKGYDILLFTEEKIPRMVAVYNTIKLKDIIKQKLRTAIARKQLKSLGISQGGTLQYQIPSALYIFKKSWGSGVRIGFYVTAWLFLTKLGDIFSIFKKLDTKKGWKLRAKR